MKMWSSYFCCMETVELQLCDLFGTNPFSIISFNTSDAADLHQGRIVDNFYAVIKIYTQMARVKMLIKNNQWFFTVKLADWLIQTLLDAFIGYEPSVLVSQAGCIAFDSACYILSLNMRKNLLLSQEEAVQLTLQLTKHFYSLLFQTKLFFKY